MNVPFHCLLISANILPLSFLCYKTLSELMHDVSTASVSNKSHNNDNDDDDDDDDHHHHTYYPKLKKTCLQRWNSR